MTEIVAELAHGDHPDEDEPDYEHHQDGLPTLFRGGLGAEEMKRSEECSHHAAATLSKPQGVRSEGVLDRLVPDLSLIHI